jgi:hypothetical protein
MVEEGHEDAPTSELATFLEMEDFGDRMASPVRYVDALQKAGFQDLALLNRGEFYANSAQSELEFMTGAERQVLNDRFGADYVSACVRSWEVMVSVMKTGELCPHFLRGQRPI